MTENNLTDGEIIHRLSHRPLDTFNGVISVDEWNRPPPITIEYERPSSLGELDRLPLELLHESCRYLDVQSLTRLSRVSLRGTAIVDTLPVYKELLKFAGYAFEIFRAMRIVNFHSMARLEATLYSEHCVSCGKYGSFLHNFTAQRCCFECLVVDSSFWAISLPLAQDCFELSTEQLATLPVMWSIPRAKGAVKRSWDLQGQEPLTGVLAANKLALKVHGSLDNLWDPANTRRRAGYYLPMRKTVLFDRCRYPTSLYPEVSRSSLILREEEDPWDMFGVVGAIPFPVLNHRSSNSVEWGLWCRGCERTYKDYLKSTKGRPGPSYCNHNGYLYKMKYQAWTRAGFLQHARHCHSSASFLEDKVMNERSM